MTPQNGNRTTPPVVAGAGKIVAWITARLEAVRATKARPAPRIPRRPKLRLPRQRWRSSYRAARRAVRAGIGGGDFLRNRLARLLGALPVTPARLPISVSIDDGGAVLWHAREGAAQNAPWLDSFLRAEGAAALGHDVQLAQADAARLAARIDTQRRRVDEMGRELEEASRTTELADPDDAAQARRMGRPPVPLPLGLALQLFALALLLAETWQLAVPCLEASGIRTRDLASELHRNAAGVVLGSIFALGAAVSLFVLAHLSLRRCLDAFEAQPEASQKVWRVLMALGASALAAAVAWSIASVRPGAQRPADVGYTRLTLFLVALAIPITTAWLLRVARRLEDARDAALGLARAWDQEHYRSLAEISRRAAAFAEEERRLATLEADRAAAVRRLQGLQQRVAAAERLAADAADAEAQDLARLADAVVAALEQDRYEYLRQAALRQPSPHRPKGPAPVPAPVREPLGGEGRNLGLAG